VVVGGHCHQRRWGWKKRKKKNKGGGGGLGDCFGGGGRGGEKKKKSPGGGLKNRTKEQKFTIPNGSVPACVGGDGACGVGAGGERWSEKERKYKTVKERTKCQKKRRKKGGGTEGGGRETATNTPPGRFGI